MSRENVEVVRRVYEALNRGDEDAVYELAHPEIVYHTWAEAPEVGIYQGREAVRRYQDSLFAAFEEMKMEPRRFIEAGELVVVPVLQKARLKGGGEMTTRFVEVYAVTDGLIAERWSYSSEAEALEAVGLRG
jgi:uncharacterized protein